jgi:deoxycytidine triphosphate deaminase
MMLNDIEILQSLDGIFQPGSASPEMIGPAKYYLTLGEEPLILPDGTQCRKETAREKPFTLKPGQTALVSTRERLTMPFSLAGIFGPTSAFSNAGLFFFGGMLVDPGFGRRLDQQVEVSDAIPLSFYLANLGADAIQLRPGEDRIGSIAFVSVNPVSEPDLDPYRTSPSDRRPSERFKRELDQIFAEEESPGRVLGLVGEVTEIGHELDKLQASVNQVVLFGVILLATTLVAVMTELILDKPKDMEPASWLETTGSVAGVVGEVGILVVLFYLAVQAVVKIQALRKRRRLGLK